MQLYRSGLADSSRWNGFAFRPGDIVISTPSKCGTTWLQMICALLVFQAPTLPASLTTLSPWLDMRLRPLSEVSRSLAAQRHRRFIKTHTPLDGLPEPDGVHFLVAGRHPLDVAVSMAHHRDNLRLDTIHQHLGGTPNPQPAKPMRDRLHEWIHDDRPPTATLNSLSSVVHHLGGAWQRRTSSTVTLVHYAGLTRDLGAVMRHLAMRLHIEVPDDRWPALVAAATFEQMRSHATDLVPDENLPLFQAPASFFHSGRHQQWQTYLTPADLTAYQARLHALATPELATWLENG